MYPGAACIAARISSILHDEMGCNYLHGASNQGARVACIAEFPLAQASCCVAHAPTHACQDVCDGVAGGRLYLSPVGGGGGGDLPIGCINE